MVWIAWSLVDIGVECVESDRHLGASLGLGWLLPAQVGSFGEGRPHRDFC